MEKQDDSFDAFLNGLQNGDSEACEEFVTRYAARLIGLAKNRLSQRLRQKVDPDDVVQSVLRTFFRRHREGGFSFDDPAEVWGLLVRITLNKCGRWAERFNAEKRGLTREHSLAVGGVNGEWDLAAAEPGPEEVALLAELTDELFRRFSGNDEQILRLLLDGHSPKEIGTLVGRSERTVQRVRQLVRIWLEEHGNDRVISGNST